VVMTPEKDFQKDLEALRADIAALTGAVGNLASQAGKAEAAIARNVKKATKDAVGAGEDLWDESVHLGSDAAKAATDGARAGMSSLEHLIGKNPLNAVLVALGIGFIVGIVRHK